MRVLIIEDHKTDFDKMSAALYDDGFVIDQAFDLQDADAAISVAHYDAMVSSRVLRDGNAVDWIRTHRRNGDQLPILIAGNECDSDTQRIEGLNAGADDYLIKPVNLAEFVARVRTLTRRPPAARNRVLTIGNVTAASEAHEISVNDRVLNLPRRETCILEMLMHRFESTVAKQYLEDEMNNSGANVTPNAVEVGIYRLRRYLKEAGATVCIDTIRGAGYSLSSV